jgi:hypothetical protein
MSGDDPLSLSDTAIRKAKAHGSMQRLFDGGGSSGSHACGAKYWSLKYGIAGKRSAWQLPRFPK